MNAPVGSRDPVYNFLCCAVELLRLVTSDDIMTSLSKKLTSIKVHVGYVQFPNCRPNASAVVVN